MTKLIAVWGAAPGIGKSTVCAGLAGWLTQAGNRVDHFAEEEIFTRPEFADVAAYFLATRRVDPRMLLAAGSRFATSVLAANVDVVVADAQVPFVPSLLAVGCSDQQVRQFVADLTAELAPVEPVLLFLDGDAATALARAEAREGPGWLKWYTSKLASYGLMPEPAGLSSAVAYLERERALTLSSARQAGWSVMVIEGATELPAADILRCAQERIRPSCPVPSR